MSRSFAYENILKQQGAIHRPKFKVLINNFLRLFQKGEFKFVIYSKSNKDNKGWYCYGYGFGRIFHNQ